MNANYLSVSDKKLPHHYRRHCLLWVLGLCWCFSKSIGRRVLFWELSLELIALGLVGPAVVVTDTETNTLLCCKKTTKGKRGKKVNEKNPWCVDRDPELQLLGLVKCFVWVTLRHSFWGRWQRPISQLYEAVKSIWNGVIWTSCAHCWHFYEICWMKLSNQIASYLIVIKEWYNLQRQISLLVIMSCHVAFDQTWQEMRAISNTDIWYHIELFSTSRNQIPHLCCNVLCGSHKNSSTPGLQHWICKKLEVPGFFVWCKCVNLVNDDKTWETHHVKMNHTAAVWFGIDQTPCLT